MCSGLGCAGGLRFLENKKAAKRGFAALVGIVIY